MSSLFHPNLLSIRFDQSFEQPSVLRITEGKQARNSPAVRGNARMFCNLLLKFALFYLILAIDAVLTAKIFLRPFELVAKLCSGTDTVKLRFKQKAELQETSFEYCEFKDTGR